MLCGVSVEGADDDGVAGSGMSTRVDTFALVTREHHGMTTGAAPMPLVSYRAA